MTSIRKYQPSMERPTKPGWLPVMERAIFVRAAIVAGVIGSVLTLINQSGWVAGTEPLQHLQLILVFLLPFGVVTTAQIAGAYQAQIDFVGHGAPTVPERFIATIALHGIPAKAFAIGLVFGSLNAAIVISELLLHSGDLTTVSIVPLGQAYLLPMLFGLVSQAIAYRRTRYQTV